MVKHLYIIAGCNGAGKTTASKTILPFGGRQLPTKIKDIVNFKKIKEYE